MAYSRVGKNAILGDGMIREGKNVGAVIFISTNLDLLNHKEKLLDSEGLKVTVKRTQKSGYGGTKTIHVYTSSSNTEINKVSTAATVDILKDLSKEDLYLWYLDDGSWHISRNTMHLYSNMLDEKESNVLMGVIERIYGIRPRLRIDRKQDGRSFYYLYFPRELVKLFRPEVERYIKDNKIESMYYKVGGKEYKEKTGVGPLPDDEVRHIRSLYKGAYGDVSRIAGELGISYNTVHGITNNKTYKDVI